MGICTEVTEVGELVSDGDALDGLWLAPASMLWSFVP